MIIFVKAYIFKIIQLFTLNWLIYKQMINSKITELLKIIFCLAYLFAISLYPAAQNNWMIVERGESGKESTIAKEIEEISNPCIICVQQ